MALLDARDQWHSRVMPDWPELIERCVTTEAVVTEASHLASGGGAAPVRPLEFLLTAGIPVVALELPALRQAALLMRRYADVPMDYADATLVVLADVLAIDTAFTTDRRGFGTYRGARGRKFELRPS